MNKTGSIVFFFCDALFLQESLAGVRLNTVYMAPCILSDPQAHEHNKTRVRNARSNRDNRPLTWSRDFASRDHERQRICCDMSYVIWRHIAASVFLPLCGTIDIAIPQLPLALLELAVFSVDDSTTSMIATKRLKMLTTRRHLSMFHHLRRTYQHQCLSSKFAHLKNYAA